MYRRLLFLGGMLVLSICASAAIFGSVRGIVHDPQHRPVQGATVTLHANSSDWAVTASTDQNGEFAFNAIPIGDYSVVAVAPGFSLTAQNVVVRSNTQPVVHFALNVAGAKERVDVSGAPEVAPTDSATPITLVDRQEIARTPG